MCDECISLDKTISSYRNFIAQGLDAVTVERLQQAVDELLQRRESMHLDERPHCPKCQMRMVFDDNSTARRCLRCGHTEEVE